MSNITLVQTARGPRVQWADGSLHLPPIAGAAPLAIPKTAAEMQEMMADPKVAAQIIAEGQLPDFVKAYATATDQRGEMRDMVTEAVTAAMAGSNALSDQVSDKVRNIVGDLMKEHGVNRPVIGSDLTTAARANALYNPLAAGTGMDELKFLNIGDFFRVAMQKGRPDDDRFGPMRKVMDAYSSLEPSAGGFLIPETMRAEIAELALEQSVVRPRADVITMSSSKQSMPYVDQTTHVGSVFGGMVFYWVPESGDFTPTEATFGRSKLEANKLTGLSRIPNELWADAPSLTSWLMKALPRGIAFFEDLAFITGNGVGQPLGVQNSLAKITITKETSQPASTINVQNVLKMYSRMLPQSLQNAVWLANPTTFPELMQLSIAVGTGGAPVMLVDMHSAPNMTMLGRPLILTEKVPALGAAGDLGFYDFGFYQIGDRQAVTIDSSEHSRFANDETEVRVIERVDGRPWIQSALTPVNGDTLSPFILLGARA